MKKSLFLCTIFLVSLLSPVALAGVTETQFQDGSTSYTHTFTGTGDGFAGNLSFPYGAEVTAASFDISGESSSTNWGNLTTDSDFGGSGTGSWSGAPPGFGYGYRTSLEVRNDQVQLRGTPTDDVNGMDRSAEATSTGTINNTGGFAANGDQGFIGSTKPLTALSLTGSSSSYRGFIVAHGDEYHSATYTSTYPSSTPVIKRYNSTTGAYIGTASISFGSQCSTTAMYYAYDATSDGNGTAWTVSYSYRLIVKWTISSTGAWTCVQSYNSPATNLYPSGVDIDEDTGKMFLLYYQSSFPNYNRYLYEVDPTNPTRINGSWLLGTREELGSTSTQPGGLVVDLPKIVTNEYYRTEGYHNHFTMDGIFVERNGKIKISGGGHYGMDQLGDNTIGYQCHYSSYCSGKTNKIQRMGSGVIYDSRSVSTSSSVVTSYTNTISRSVTELTVSALVGYIPSNTSIELEVSNDGGTTWMSGVFNQKLTFPSAGSSIVWKAYLNGTSTETPVLDFVSLSYTANYLTSGYMYLRSSGIYSSTTGPVAITTWWNASTPSGTSISVEIRDSGSTKTVSNSGDTTQLTWTSSYLYIYVRFYSSGSDTPTIEDLNFAMYTNAPERVGIDIGGDGSDEWESQGILFGTTTQGGINFVNEFNKLIPDTGAGTAIIPVHVTSESAGIVTLERFSVTYTINTVNLDITIPEGEILHERTEPYEVVTRHIVGDGATNYIQSLNYNS